MTEAEVQGWKELQLSRQFAREWVDLTGLRRPPRWLRGAIRRSVEKILNARAREQCRAVPVPPDLRALFLGETY